MSYVNINSLEILQYIIEFMDNKIYLKVIIKVYMTERPRSIT